MAFCASCGNEVVGKFCGKCGAALPAGAPAPSPQSYPPQQGGGYAPQPQGGYAPPQQGGYAPPQQGGYAPPQQGGYAPPQQGGYAPPQQGGYAPPQQGGGYAPPPPAAQAGGLTDNVAAALSYITIIGIVFLFIEPYNTNRVVRFHAFQSIFFAVAAFVLEVAATILSIVLSALPVIGFIFGSLLHLVLGLGILIVWLVLAYKAYNNEQFVLPVIGPMAQKQV